MLRTVLAWKLPSGARESIEIVDFFPRFEQFGRMYRPLSLFRRVRAIEGSPLVRFRVNPVRGWSKVPAKAERGNSHFRYDLEDGELRLLTNVSLVELEEGRGQIVNAKGAYFALTWGVSLEDDLVTVYEGFLERTLRYWRTWVRHCSIPTYFQKETIRSALALKLHVYEETGAILAALTTSLPEAPGEVRNWDYRFCWLRDAFYTLSAFRNLGHFEEVEGFLQYLLALVKENEADLKRLAPVYSLSRALPLPELEHGAWRGRHDARPVRSGNQAAEHVQNDVYGEMILAILPLYLDERFSDMRTPDLDRIVEYLGKLCDRSVDQPDAGLWEIRGDNQVHSFTNLVCLTALRSLERLRAQGLLEGVKEKEWKKAAERAEAAVRAAIGPDGVIQNGPRDATLDSSLLQMAHFAFSDEKAVRATVERIERELSLAPGFLYRYRRPDDFGSPSSAFMICSFWLIEALASIGDRERALGLMENVMTSANHLRLFAEHFDPATKTQLGNFPQAYSHVGLINAAFAVSPDWATYLGRDPRG
ncbi:MAG: glycoside hydrolase family 15 protein [Bdellovibrionales bacterium]|nr:glycoside hydrolase family 15 protein [Bdellovibrionales bacterium]